MRRKRWPSAATSYWFPTTAVVVLSVVRTAGARRRPRLCDGSSDACQRVSIPAKRDCLPHGIFKVARLEERDEGRRHGPLARPVELVHGSKHPWHVAKVVAEHPLDRVFDVPFAFALSSQEDSYGRGLCPFELEPFKRQSATATVSTVSSVNLQPGGNNTKSIDFVPR